MGFLLALEMNIFQLHSVIHRDYHRWCGRNGRLKVTFWYQIPGLNALLQYFQVTSIIEEDIAADIKTPLGTHLMPMSYINYVLDWFWKAMQVFWIQCHPDFSYLFIGAIITSCLCQMRQVWSNLPEASFIYFEALRRGFWIEMIIERNPSIQLQVIEQMNTLFGWERRNENELHFNWKYSCCITKCTKITTKSI